MAWRVLRTVLAGLVAAHGYTRLLNGEVSVFGEWLSTQHIPLPLAVAWAVTLSEVVGSLLLMVGRWVFPVAILLSVIYAVGIAMVHAHSGWFVVGGGRNGAEYSVLLIVALLCMGVQHAPIPREAP
jgi:putative oxidoreductase